MDSNIIKKRRKELGITLEEIGSFLGVSKSTVLRWETGKIKKISKSNIILLSEILQISPSALTTFNNENFITIHTEKNIQQYYLTKEQIRFIQSLIDTMKSNDVDL